MTVSVTPAELDQDLTVPAPPRPGDARRFTWSCVVATALVAVPFLWLLWGPWESPNPIRKTAFEDNFYDLQARAMFHGHLWLAKGAVGIEAFVHGGRQYTYFGIFPSILRMPVLLVTSRLDGKLTAPMILLAWTGTAVVMGLLLWRIRTLVRPDAPLGRAESLSLAAVQATVLGGSVFMLLAVTPYVFNEDLAWSIFLTVGSVFCLLGVMEHPSASRVAWSGVFVVCANLNRATTGGAVALAALLVGVWFWVGRGGVDRRRWGGWTFAVGILALVLGAAVNEAKFGVPLGVSNLDQVWTKVNAYRRQFLASNHDSEWGPHFIPTTALAYLRPDGIRLTSVFPFVSLPAGPPAALGGVLFDRRYRTASLPVAMPLLFLLTLWGLVTAFRRRAVGRVAHTRIFLVCTALAAGVLLIWGYIAPRYLADVLPFLALGAAVGIADVWRRMDGRSRRARTAVAAVVLAAAVASVWGNLAMALSPTEEFNQTQVVHYVQMQQRVARWTGTSLAGRVHTGSTLPPWAPADQFFVVGDCDGLYISNGEDYSTVPSEQYTRTTWMVVERGPRFQRPFRVVPGPSGTGLRSVPLAGMGGSTVAVSSRPSTRGVVVDVALHGPHQSVPGLGTPTRPGVPLAVTVVTDPAKHLVQVTVGGTVVLSATVGGGDPSSGIAPTTTVSVPGLAVTALPAPAAQTGICRSLHH